MGVDFAVFFPCQCRSTNTLSDPLVDNTLRFPRVVRLNGTLVAGLSFADVAHEHGLRARLWWRNGVANVRARAEGTALLPRSVLYKTWGIRARNAAVGVNRFYGLMKRTNREHQVLLTFDLPPAFR